MNDLQKELGIKNMSNLAKKETHDVYSTKNSIKGQIKEYKRRGKELYS